MLGSDEEGGRPPPVEVLLDDNTSTPRRTPRGVNGRSPTPGGRTIRRTILMLAVGALAGAGVSQGLAHSSRPTATSTTAAPVIAVESRHDQPADFALSSGGLVNALVASLDAITQTQIAQAATTDGPQQIAAIQFLRQQHDDVRALILSYYYGWLPYPMP
jgi:hypothetical protein